MKKLEFKLGSVQALSKEQMKNVVGGDGVPGGGGLNNYNCTYQYLDTGAWQACVQAATGSDAQDIADRDCWGDNNCGGVDCDYTAIADGVGPC